jgi:large subunit ribosomal protein L24
MSKKVINKHKVKCRIKQGDEIVVIAGRDKGKQGPVKAVSRKLGRAKLKVEGINMVKKHVKANPQQGVEGGIIPKEALIDVSNVMIYNSSTGKGDRIGYKMTDDGRKVRFYKSTGELIDAE